MSLATKIRVKFGLRDDPTEQQLEDWAREVAELIAWGEDPELAARIAAFRYFDGVDQVFYGSQADNIQALLKALSAKKG